MPSSQSTNYPDMFLQPIDVTCWSIIYVAIACSLSEQRLSCLHVQPARQGWAITLGIFLGILTRGHAFTRRLSV